MAEKKYYWLKLKKDFFKRHDIRIIESMPNGKDYVLFYLKMLVESIDHEGGLRFNETIPYNVNMLATITNTNPDVVKSAMEVFTQLNMIEVLADETIFMNEVERLIGTETYWAEQKRKQRQTSVDNVLLLSNVSNQEIEKEIEKDKEIKEKPVKIKYADRVSMTEEEYQKLIAEYGEQLTKDKITDLDLWKGSKGKSTKSDYLTIKTWIRKEEKNKPVQTNQQMPASAAYKVIGKDECPICKGKKVIKQDNKFIKCPKCGGL